MRTTIAAGEVFVFFLAPLVFFNYIGAIKDTKPPRQGDYADETQYIGYGLSLPWTITYSVGVFLWLFAILTAGAVKLGLWANVGKKVKTAEDQEKENEKKSEEKVKDQTTNRMSQSNQSISRKWSLTLEKSKSISIVKNAKQNKEANKNMFRKWRLTVEDSKSIQFVCSSDDKEENVNQDKAPSRENSQDFNQDPVENDNAVNESKGESESELTKESIYLHHPKITAKTLTTLRVIYITVSILIVTYFAYNFATAGDLSNLYLNFCFIIAGTALILGEVYHYREFELLRKDTTKKKILLAIIFYYVSIAATATVALYMFTQKQVYLSGDDVAKSRDNNLDCLFLDYYDYHSMWHVFGSFMLLAAGLRVGQLSEPCRMCALKLIGDTSRTPSVAMDTSLFGINKEEADKAPKSPES